MLGAIYRPDSFVLMLRYCANLKAIRYESTSLNRIVADTSHRVIVALELLTNCHMEYCSEDEHSLPSFQTIALGYLTTPNQRDSFDICTCTQRVHFRAKLNVLSESPN